MITSGIERLSITEQFLEICTQSFTIIDFALGLNLASLLVGLGPIYFDINI
jgi:hypothetical protein